jgi:hypothetical protein
MSMTAKATIAEKAVKILAQSRDGLRYSVLADRLKTALPEMSINTIRGTLVGLVEFRPEEVYKPAQGLFQHTKYQPGDKAAEASAAVPAVAPRGSRSSIPALPNT